MAAVTERIDIRVREDGSRVVARSLEQVGEAGTKAATGVAGLQSSIGSLKTVMYGLASALMLRELKEYADTWMNISNSIKLSTKSSEEATAVEDRLFQVAQRTRSSIEDLVPLYRRTAQSAGNLNASQQQMIDLTEGVGMAVAIQGTKLSQARGALLQFGQMLGMARARAQEFNSINENAPRILQAVADNIDGAGGSIQRLRMMLLKGKLSGKDFFDAFQKALPKLREEFALTTPTIGQALTVLDNALGRLVFQGGRATGITEGLAQGIIWISRHLDTFAKILVATGSGLAIVFGPQLLAMLSTAGNALRGLMVSMAANPFLLLAGAITAATMALLLFKDEILIVKSESISLGDYMTVVWDVMVSGATRAARAIKNVLTPAIDGAEDAQSTLGEMFLTQLALMGVKMNHTIGLFVGFGNAVKLIVKGVQDAIIDMVVSSLNKMIDVVEKTVNGLIILSNVARSLRGEELLPLQNFKRLENPMAGSAQDLGEKVRQAFLDGYNADYVFSVIEEWTKRAKEASNARLAAKGNKADLNTKPGGGASDAGDLGAKDKWAQKWRALVDSIDLVGAAEIRAAEGAAMLQQAEDKGIISHSRRIQLLELLTSKYAEAMQPYETMMSNLQKEAGYLTMDSEARASLLQLMEKEKALRTQGVILTAEQREELRKQLLLNEQLKKDQNELERIERKLIQPKKDLIYTQRALNKLYADGRISARQYNLELIEMRMNLGQGSWSDGFISQLNIMSDSMSNFAARTGQAFADLTTSIVDGFSNAVGHAIAFGDSIKDVKQALGDMARNALAQLISALIKMGIQMAMNFALGTSMGAAALASNSAMASASAAAWATPAALASLATLGENSLAATAGMASTIAAAQGMAQIKGYAAGGYTGNGSRSGVAGLVHGREFVVNADATSRHRATLEAMNSGAAVSGGNVALNVTVVNQSTASIEVERLSETEVRIIARDEAKRAVASDTPAIVAADISNPNSRTAKALNQFTTTERRRS
jgi:tape measure domain-containing protein